MTVEELWEKSNLKGEYEVWSFDEAPDKLLDLVVKGIKTATCSPYDTFMHTKEPLPHVGGYSILLNTKKEPVCIIKTTKVNITSFKDVSSEHAYKEGEGDRSLAYWQEVHESFLRNELKKLGLSFHQDVKVVLEEFELSYIDQE